MFLALEHEFLKILKRNKILAQPTVLAVSGGADSMALLHLFVRTQRVHKNQITVVHCHHGDFENKKFRNQAAKLVKNYCDKQQISLVQIKNENSALTSENDYRKFRYESFASLHVTPETYFVTAHHLQDLLETRLMRLMRGVGRAGLKAINEKSEKNGLKLVRPLLTLQPDALREYLRQQKIQWAEDPSNQNTEKLRSFVRHKWLMPLKEQFPGSLQVLVRSLEQLTENMPQKQKHSTIALLQNKFHELSQNAKLLCLQEYVQSRGCAQLRRSQTEEILKEIERARLDKFQTKHTFTIGGLVWEVNAQQITASPTSK